MENTQKAQVLYSCVLQKHNYNNSDKFDIGHGRTKVKVMARLSNFSPLNAIQNFMSHNSTSVQARKLILGVYVYLTIVYKFYKYRHA